MVHFNSNKYYIVSCIKPLSKTVIMALMTKLTNSPFDAFQV